MRYFLKMGREITEHSIVFKMKFFVGMEILSIMVEELLYALLIKMVSIQKVLSEQV